MSHMAQAQEDFITLDAARSAIARYPIHLKEFRPLKDGRGAYMVTAEAERRYLLKLVTPQGGEDYAYPRNVFHTRRQLALSMAILRRLAQHGLGTAQPVSNLSGAFVTELGESFFATLTTFVDAPVFTDLPDDLPARQLMARAAGEATARLHTASGEALLGMAAQRPRHLKAYQRRVLARIEGGVGRTITVAQYQMLRQGSLRIEACLDRAAAEPLRRVGLIHTDIRSANLCYDGTRAIPIDFARAAYGPYLYDLGEMCAHMGESVRGDILRGYHGLRPLSAQDVLDVQAFFVQFLLCVLAERAQQPADAWLTDTVDKLVTVYIPGLDKGGFFDDADHAPWTAQSGFKHP